MQLPLFINQKRTLLWNLFFPNNSSLILILLLFFCVNAKDLNQHHFPFNNLVISFNRIVTEKQKPDTTQGIFYYQKNERFIVKVQKPVFQWMILDGSAMSIYYPQSKLAFRIKSGHEFEFPLINSIVLSFNPGQEFIDQGFQVKKTETKGDTIVLYLLSPSQLKKIVDEIILETVRNNYVFVKTFSPDHFLLATTKLSHFTNCGNIQLPFSIENAHFKKGYESKETVIFSNASINTVIPDSVRNFTIPIGINIKEIQW